MRFLTSLAMIAAGVIAISFAASNRELVDLTIWPLPFSLTAPIYALALACLAVGIVWGACVAWLGAGRARARARAEARRAGDLEKDLRELKAKIEVLEPARTSHPLV
jgi:hypothetical protein